MRDDEITALIEQRNIHRRDRQYAEADVIKQSLKVHVPGIKILDTPFKQGGGSTWYIEVVLPSEVSLVELSKEVFKINDPTSEAVIAIVQEAKHYCNLCEQHRGKYEGSLRPSDAQGRQWADAAFHFAMGGVQDEALYGGLVEGARAELKRVGNRKSFRSIDIIQIAEKFASAGVLDQSLYLTISELVREKTPSKAALPDSIPDLQSGKYTLLSDRPLYALFRFAARQSKHGRQREYVDDDDLEDEGEGEGEGQYEEEVLQAGGGDADSSSKPNEVPSDFDVNTLFENPTLPLVFDLGCGYGVSLLGLSYTYAQDEESPAKYNFLGCDMSARAINFANGICHRWSMHKQCAFIVSDIVKGLKIVQNYAGPVHWVSINFPTPYRQVMIPEMIETYSLAAECEVGSRPSHTLEQQVSSCNSQLPSLISDFMVTREVYQLIETLFRSSLNTHQRKAYLYLQSNVQDVAIVMNGMLVEYLQSSQAVFDSMSVLSETTAWFDMDKNEKCLTLLTKKRKLEDVNDTPVPSQRQLFWKEKGGKDSLSGFILAAAYDDGDGGASTKSELKESSEFWLEESPLPGLAKTETEVMCKYNNKPVYRQLFSFAAQK
jgi:hypothetical protein